MSTLPDAFSERDVCTKLITPAILAAGWDSLHQIREEVTLTAGRFLLGRGAHAPQRGERKRADYVLYAQPNIPLAVIEAKDARHPVGAGMPQALHYADLLDVPFVSSSNGSGFASADR